MNTTTEIRVAEIRKTFDTIGSVRYICVFQATEGNWRVDDVETQHKSYASARGKLDKLIAKHGARYAPSFTISQRAIKEVK